MLEELGEELAPPRAIVEIDVHLLSELEQPLAVTQGVVTDLKTFLFQCLTHPLHHRQASIRRREVDLVLAVGERLAAVDPLHERGQELFGVRHHPFVVAVRFVPFEHRELGVVPGGDALVPKVAVDLVYLFEATDGEPLQIELGRDAQEELDPESVVKRLERSRHRTTRHRLQHRGLDLDIAVLVEEIANLLNETAPGDEHRAGVFVCDQIQIPLAVTELDVGEAVPLLGKRLERFREERELFDFDGQLVGLRAKERPFDTDEITDVELLVDGEARLFDFIAADVGLEPTGAVTQSKKPGFAELVDSDDTPRSADNDRLRIELVGGLRVERVESFRHGVRPVEPRGVDVHPERFEVGSFRPPLLFDTFVDSHYRLSEAPSILLQTASSTPLIKLTASGAENRLATSSASLITTLFGVFVSMNS